MSGKLFRATNKAQAIGAHSVFVNSGTRQLHIEHDAAFLHKFDQLTAELEPILHCDAHIAGMMVRIRPRAWLASACFKGPKPLEPMSHDRKPASRANCGYVQFLFVRASR